MDEYTASPLEQLIPSRLSRSLLIALLPAAMSVAGAAYGFADLESKGEIELFALGINFDVARYYAASITIKTAEDLGTSLIGLLEGALARRRGKPDG